MVTFNPAKTEVLYFGNQTPPLLKFNNDVLTSTDTHKHLGVTLSHDYKWHTHIYNILLSASRLLGIVRKLEYSVRRKSMNQIYIYISFLRPILEYASVVWDNCTQYEKNRLEHVQIEAAIHVSGVMRSITLNTLYNDIGWLTLGDRRTYQKIVLTFKIKNNMVPDYLSDLFPRSAENPQYNLRQQNDF